MTVSSGKVMGHVERPSREAGLVRVLKAAHERDLLSAAKSFGGGGFRQFNGELGADPDFTLNHELAPVGFDQTLHDG
jgi:hypothetical protein